MESTIQKAQPVSTEIRRIIEERIDTAIGYIDGEMDHHETVHEVRRRCKEVRAGLRLVRSVTPTYSEENAHYRDAARRISAVRDAQAAVEIYDTHVRPAAASTFESGTLDEMRAALIDRRDGLASASIIETRLENVREDLQEGRERIADLPIEGDGFDAVAGGLWKSYRRAHNRMEAAYENPDFEAFHEWRKRVEYHRDHVGLLSHAWDGPMEARRAELQRLAKIIGDETDLAEFATIIDDEELFDNATREELEHVVGGRRSHLRRQARPLGEQLFAEAADDIVARYEQYWTATREIDHDASDLSVAVSSQPTKTKPKPRPDSTEPDGEQTTGDTLPTTMQKYSDKWYEPDSDTYQYAVRMPDGNRAYRKTTDGAVSVLEQYYEEPTDDTPDGTS